MQRKTKSQARLQHRILIILAEQPANSITDLARRADASRPSVSRAVKVLAERRLVERSRRVVSISRLGHKETEAFLTGSVGFRRAIEQRQAWQRMVGGDLALAARSVLGTYDALRPSIEMFGVISAAQREFAENAKAITAMAAAPLHDLAAVQAFGLNLSQEVAVAAKFAVADLRPALSAMAEMNRIQGEAVAVAANANSWWGQLAAESLAPTSGMLADLSATSRAIASQVAGLEGFRQQLIEDVNAVVSANAAHTTALLAAMPNIVPSHPSQFVRDFTLPTYGTARFVHGARQLIAPAPTSPSPNRRRLRGLPHLEEVLSERHPEAADEWKAAWDALERLGPGWSRASAHHARESLRLVLVHVSPERSLTQVARVTRALGEGSVTIQGWAIAQAEAARETYRTLAAEAHEPRLSPDGLAAIMEAAGSVMYLLLTYTGRDHSNDRQD